MRSGNTAQQLFPHFLPTLFFFSLSRRQHRTEIFGEAAGIVLISGCDTFGLDAVKVLML